MSEEKKPRARRRTKAEMEAARAAAADGPGPGAPTPSIGADGNATVRNNAGLAHAPIAAPETEAVKAPTELIEAIRWCDMAQSEGALLPVYETHSLVSNGWLLATNGVLTVGSAAPGLEGFYSPHTARLLAALTKAGTGLQITRSDDRLTINSKKVRLVVPCLPGGSVNVPYPEQPQFAAGDAITAAIEAVLPCVKAGAQTVLESSIMLTTWGTALATDRKLVVEAYHGFSLPYNVIIPRQLAANMKGKTGLIGFALGYANDAPNAITFWYEGQTKFIRSMLHEAGDWPNGNDFGAIFTTNTQAGDVPKDLVAAIVAVAPHCVENNIYLSPTSVLSARTDDEAEAVYQVSGHMPHAQGVMCFDANTLAKGLEFAEAIDWTDGLRALFTGKRKETHIRGAITTCVPPSA